MWGSLSAVVRSVGVSSMAHPTLRWVTLKQLSVCSMCVMVQGACSIRRDSFLSYIVAAEFEDMYALLLKHLSPARPLEIVPLDTPCIRDAPRPYCTQRKLAA